VTRFDPLKRNQIESKNAVFSTQLHKKENTICKHREFKQQRTPELVVDLLFKKKKNRKIVKKTEKLKHKKVKTQARLS